MEARLGRGSNRREKLQREREKLVIEEESIGTWEVFGNEKGLTLLAL